MSEEKTPEMPQSQTDPEALSQQEASQDQLISENSVSQISDPAAQTERCAQTAFPAVSVNESFVVLSQRCDMNDDCLSVLTSLNIKPVILNDPNEKKALIELVSEHPKIQFAMILLAGDDFIYDRLTGKPGEALLSPKANVIFHLGYLQRHFGNLKTLVLFKEQKSFRLPTGVQNAAFVPYVKNGVWIEILRSKINRETGS